MHTHDYSRKLNRPFKCSSSSCSSSEPAATAAAAALVPSSGTLTQLPSTGGSGSSKHGDVSTSNTDA
eukprot:1491-Heterococcus_DN1.PRE.3